MNPIQAMLGATRRGLGSLKVVMATGLYKTAAGVVGARLLKENREALRCYLTVHLRSGKAAQNALAAIADTLEHGKADELKKGPSQRAALFLIAKNLIEWERLFGDGQTEQPLASVPWEPVPIGRPDGWSRVLDEMRFGLGAAEAEILELHYARDLNAEEVAYVLGTSRSDIEKRLEAGAAYARLLLEDVLGDDAARHFETILRDAFAIAPPTPEDMAAAKSAIVPLAPGTIIGERYEIESRIGGGEFAFVYRARDVRVPGHVVALKLLHRVARTAAAREGAIRELSLIASAFHPSLVAFKDHGWFEDRLWFVMPFYEGEELLERLERGPLPLEEALQHFERLARGLAALHAAGIRHQDIKPENIFLVELATGGSAESKEVLPILLDLGVATPSGEMALAGTPMYFPPEVAARLFDERCDIPLTPKADVFALALSLLHAIEEPDLSDLEGLDLDAFLKERVKRVPSGPRSRKLAFLKPYFERWLAPHPNDRPSAGQLADELASILKKRTGRRRAIAAPAGLSRGLTSAGLGALTLASILLVDAPEPRAVEPAAVVPPSESERVLLLRRRLEAEERRSRELEEELETYRRRAFDLEDPPEHDPG